MRLSYKSGQKENLRSYRPASLTLVPRNVLEQIVLSAIMWQMEDNRASDQPGFRKHRSCLANWISFYNKVTHLVDEGKVFHSILLDKWYAHSLEKRTVH